MLNETLQRKIDNMVQECVIKEFKNRAIENKVRKIVSEVTANHIKNKLNEKKDNDTKRNTVMKILNSDGKFNHAELMRKLWHPKDRGEEDTLRSLFSKCVSGKPDNDGAIRHFSDDEINSLYEILRSK